MQLSPQLIPDFFLTMSQRYCKITRAIWACLVKPIKNDAINLEKTFRFISMQNHTTQLFIEILQRYCIIVILSILGVPCYTHHQCIENFDGNLHKTSISSLTSFLRYHKDFANLLFSVTWVCLVLPTKINRIKLQEPLALICM